MTEADESYTSHNTTLLDVEGTVKKILTTDYVKEQLNKQLVVCLLITWLCCFVVASPDFSFKLFHVLKLRIDGGRIIMAINNTLIMVQTGFPTGGC